MEKERVGRGLPTAVPQPRPLSLALAVQVDPSGNCAPNSGIDEDTKNSGRGGAELTSEASEGHCAKLVVSVHSLKLRGKGHRVKVGCWLSTALPALFLQIYAPAGLLAH